MSVLVPWNYSFSLRPSAVRRMETVADSERLVSGVRHLVLSTRVGRFVSQFAVCNRPKLLSGDGAFNLRKCSFAWTLRRACSRRWAAGTVTLCCRTPFCCAGKEEMDDVYVSVV